MRFNKLCLMMMVITQGGIFTFIVKDEYKNFKTNLSIFYVNFELMVFKLGIERCEQTQTKNILLLNKNSIYIFDAIFQPENS